MPATMARMIVALERADEFCREQRLLVLTASPQQKELVRWWCEEFARQAEGKEPKQARDLTDLLLGVVGARHAYFVNSYHLRGTEPANVLATVEYGGAITAMVGRDNLFGTQFHPEKSQAVGLRLIKNFGTWK